VKTYPAFCGLTEGGVISENARCLQSGQSRASIGGERDVSAAMHFDREFDQLARVLDHHLLLEPGADIGNRFVGNAEVLRDAAEGLAPGRTGAWSRRPNVGGLRSRLSSIPARRSDNLRSIPRLD
jgi:hypothetical protein